VLEDETLYVTGSNGLHALSVSEPASPQIVGHLPLSAGTLAVAGTLAYVSTDDGLHIVDVSEPGEMRVVSRWTERVGVPQVVECGAGQYVIGTRGYSDHSELRVIDVTKPSAPRLAGRYVQSHHIAGLAASGCRLFVSYVDGGSNLDVLDVSRPATPRLVQTLESVGSARGLSVAGGHLYVAVDSGLKVFAIAVEELAGHEVYLPAADA
jgi:hypothetical protein